MQIAGAVRLGVPLVLLAVLAACTSADGAAPSGRPDGAVPGYEAPAGAPDFCTRLAALTALDRLPVSIGMLAARTDVEARTQVSAAMRELRGVLTGVRSEGGHDGLAAALDGLVHTLGRVGAGPLLDPVRGEVTAGLEQVAVQAQPVCGFPT